MPVSKAQTDFLLSTYAPEKTGSIGFQWRPEQLPLKLNFRQSEEPISTNVIPGVGTYTEHLVKMQQQHRQTGMPPETPVHYGMLGGKKDERIERMKEEIRKSRPEKKWAEEELTQLASEIILEEDKTMNLQLLEQSRSHRDLMATSLAFEGSGKLWPVSTGMGSSMNPMYASGATSAVNEERRTKRKTPARTHTIEIAIKTLHDAIKRSKDLGQMQAFKERRWLYHSIKALRNVLKKVDDPLLRAEFKEVIKLYYRKKK